MKSLIVEDDFTSRLILQEILKKFGAFHIAANGVEAVQAVKVSLEDREPYDLICLDIMMPDKNGQQALKEIRQMEEENSIASLKRSKIIMITASGDPKNVAQAIRGIADAYILKPLHKNKLLEELKKLKLI